MHGIYLWMTKVLRWGGGGALVAALCLAALFATVARGGEPDVPDWMATPGAIGNPLEHSPAPAAPPVIVTYDPNIAARTTATSNILYNSAKTYTSPASISSYAVVNNGYLNSGYTYDSDSQYPWNYTNWYGNNPIATTTISELTVGSGGRINGTSTLEANGGNILLVDYQYNLSGNWSDGAGTAIVVDTVTMSGSTGTGNLLYLQQGEISGTVNVVNGNILLSGANATVSGSVTTSTGANQWQIGQSTITGILTADGAQNDIVVGPNAVFNSAADLQLTGTMNTLHLTGGTFNTGSKISASGTGTSNILIDSGTTLNAGSSISLESNINHIEIKGTANLDESVSITTTDQTLISTVLLEGLNNFKSDILLQSTEENTVYIGEDVKFADTASVKIVGYDNETDNTVVIDTKSKAAEYVVKLQIDLSEVKNTSDPRDLPAGHKTTDVHIVSGILKSEDASGVNQSSVKGPSDPDAIVNYYVSGGMTTYIDAYGGKGNYVFSGGVFDRVRPIQATEDLEDENQSQVYNILNAQANSNVLNPGGTVGYYGGDYMHYQLQNLGTIVLGQDANNPDVEDPARYTRVTIGAIEGPGGNNAYAAINLNSSYAYDEADDIDISLRNDTTDYSPYWVDAGQGGQAQITVDKAGITAGSKLTIHDNQLNFDKTTIEDDTANIINELYIGREDIYTDGVLTSSRNGRVTLDRTTIQGVTNDLTPQPTGSRVTVDGILHGFGSITSEADHNGKRANVVGAVTVNAGGTLQPYDRDIFTDIDNKSNFYGAYTTKANTSTTMQQQVDKLKGLVFGVDGDIVFKAASRLSTRLFHDDDRENTVDYADGDHIRQYSDSVSATQDIDFSDIWDGSIAPLQVEQAKKLIYDPVFGFQYELRSKQDFLLYKADGTDDKTYYYSVANPLNGRKINELYAGAVAGGTLLADANHIANRYILKSDMLGEWFFLPNKTGDELTLRFRMLALHPTMGGLKLNMEQLDEHNEIKVAQYLDELRYPFQGVYGSDIAHRFAVDESADMTYRNEGYDGDMAKFYARYADPDSPDYNPIYDNYDARWIEDWENLLMGIQLVGRSGRSVNRTLEMIQPETYANIGETTLNAMQQFIQLRERNSISALFQVENDEWLRPDNRALTMYDPVLDEGHMDRFVVNPVRFWASAFGSQAKYFENHHESGYKSRIYGGGVGMIKEYGDYYAGVTGGYARVKNNFDNLNRTESSTDSYLLEGLLGARLFGMGFAELHANYSHNENKNRRVVDFRDELGMGYYGAATGDFASRVIGGGVRFGWQKLICANWLLVPTLGVNVMRHTAAAFEEEGPWRMANRMIFDRNAMDRTVVRVPLEARLSRAFAFGDNVLSPEIRAGFSPILGRRRGSATAEWAGLPIKGRKFTAHGLDRGWYEAWAGATLEFSRRGRMYVAANYDFMYGENSRGHNFSLQAGLNF